MSEVSITQTLNTPMIQNGIRYRLVHKRLKNWVLAGKPGSPQEIERRINEFLMYTPKAQKIITDAGVTIQKLVLEFS